MSPSHDSAKSSINVSNWSPTASQLQARPFSEAEAAAQASVKNAVAAPTRAGAKGFGPAIGGGAAPAEVQAKEEQRAERPGFDFSKVSVFAGGNAPPGSGGAGSAGLPSFQAKPMVQRQAEPEGLEEEEQASADGIQRKVEAGAGDEDGDEPDGGDAPGGIQAKLTIGQPGDKYEQEADQMAARVVSMPEPAVQRAESPLAPLLERGENVQPRLQAKGGAGAASADFEQRLGGTKGSGAPLGEDVRSFMEPRFGADFSQVRVHTGSEAVQLNKEVGAQAFAHGNDVYFNSGKYSPDSSSGKELLAHELTHTIQQTGEKKVQQASHQHTTIQANNVLGQNSSVLKQQALLQNSRKDAATLLKAFQGLGTSTDTVYRVLNQAPEIIKSIQSVYDQQFNSHTKKGLVEDLRYEFDHLGSKENWIFVVAQLKRAGIEVPRQQNLRYKRYSANQRTRIEPNPNSKVALLGQNIVYQLVRGPEIHSPGSYYSYQWYILYDSKGSKKYRRSSRTSEGTSYKQSVNFSIEGTHKVICKVVYHPAGQSSQEPNFYEFSQPVVSDRSLADTTLKKTKEQSFGQFTGNINSQLGLLSPNNQPADSSQPHIVSNSTNPVKNTAKGSHSKRVTYQIQNSHENHIHQWYVKPLKSQSMPQEVEGIGQVNSTNGSMYSLGEGKTASWPTTYPNIYVIICKRFENIPGEGRKELPQANFLQTVLNERGMRQVATLEKYLKGINEKYATQITGTKAPVKAVHVDKKTAATNVLNLYLGKSSDGNGYRLLDLTPGLDPEKVELVYEGNTVESVLSDFDSDNKYSEGRISLEIRPNPEVGIPRTINKSFATDGQSLLSSLSSAAGWTALGLGVAGIAAVPFTGGSSLLVTSLIIGSATAGVAAGTLSIFDQLENEKLNSVNLAIDGFGIAADLLTLGLAGRGLWAGRQAVNVASRSVRYLMYAELAAGTGSFTLISVQGISQIQKIIATPNMSEEQKNQAIVRVLAGLAATGGLLILSAGDLRKTQNRLSKHIDAAALTGLNNEQKLILDLLNEKILGNLSTASHDEIRKIIRLLGKDPSFATKIGKYEGYILKALKSMKGDAIQDFERSAIHLKLIDSNINPKIINSFLQNDSILKNLIALGNKPFDELREKLKNIFIKASDGEFKEKLETLALKDSEMFIKLLGNSPLHGLKDFLRRFERELNRIRKPVDGLYSSVPADLKINHNGWNITTEVSGSTATSRIEFRGPDGSVERGNMIRSYDPKTSKFVMEVAFLDKLPSFIDVGKAMIAKKGGTPLVTFLSIHQMKIIGVIYGSIKKVKMSTIQNFETIIHLNWLKRKFPDKTFDELIMNTHSVSYAETAISQSGHKVLYAKVGGKGAYIDSVGSLMKYYEMQDPRNIKRYNELLKKYGFSRSEKMYMNFDIELHLAPFTRKR